jgi:hypothetical protein
MTQVDLRRGVLDELRQRQIKETIDEVIEDLSDHIDQPPAAAAAPEPFALRTQVGPLLSQLLRQVFPIIEARRRPQFSR